jgi:hypothetical protein
VYLRKSETKSRDFETLYYKYGTLGEGSVDYEWCVLCMAGMGPLKHGMGSRDSLLECELNGWGVLALEPLKPEFPT